MRKVSRETFQPPKAASRRLERRRRELLRLLTQKQTCRFPLRDVAPGDLLRRVADLRRGDFRRRRVLRVFRITGLGLEDRLLFLVRRLLLAIYLNKIFFS